MTRALARALLPALALLVAGCSAPTDRDHDGVPDTRDFAPDDPLESRDSDGDGVGDQGDGDDDNDGIIDEHDHQPYVDANLTLAIDGIRTLDPLDGEPAMGIFYELEHEGVAITRHPANGTFRGTPGTYLRTPVEAALDVDDGRPTAIVRLRAFFETPRGPEPLDIDPAPDSATLTWTYTVSTGALAPRWEGPVDGSDDGSHRTDENDAYLEFTWR